MEEIKAKAIMEAYNKKYEDKVTLGQVKEYLATRAFFNISSELAATIMHDKVLG